MCSQAATYRKSRLTLVQSGLTAGGVEKVISGLATHLAQLGYSVTVLAIKGYPQDSFYPLPREVVLRTMESEIGAEAVDRSRSRILWIRRCLRESRADLAISFLTKINIQTAIACSGLPVKRIASERNNFQLQKMNPLWRGLMPVALATANHAVMLTNAQRAALPAIARRNASVIYNAVALPAFDSSRPPATDIVAVGRLTEQKGFDVLLQAIRLGRDTGHDLRLTIYGEGEDRAKLERLCNALGLEDAVVLAGRTRRPHAWMDPPGIFVLSSHYEGFGNVVLEAMAAGFAVISTACNWGPPEILTDGKDGLLVPPGDAQALAAAIVRLHGDTELRCKLAAAAQRRAHDFSEAQFNRQWVQKVETVLGNATDSDNEAIKV